MTFLEKEILDSKNILNSLFGCNRFEKLFNNNKLFNSFECKVADISKYSGYFEDDLIKELYKIVNKINPEFYNCYITDLINHIQDQLILCIFLILLNMLI